MFRRDPATAPRIDRGMALRRRIEMTAERRERDEPMRAMALYQLGQRLRDGRTSVAEATARFEAMRAEERGGASGQGGDTDEENDALWMAR